VLAAATDQAYAGVTLRLRLRLRDGRLEDRFTCVSQEEHVYDWAFHSAGRFSSSLDFTPRTEPPGDANGYQHIENVVAAKTDGGWWARWEQDGAQYTLRVEAVPGTEVFTGAGPGKNPADRITLVIIRRRAKSTVFEITHENR